MSTIFGYPTIEAEIVGLINKANADYGSDFTAENLDVQRGEFDSFESRQRFIVKDLSGRYFGVRDDIGVFKRNFQTLFKGIELHVQAGSGLTNRKILESLCATYGLPPFEDSDFAPGLLDLNTDAGDSEIFISWPIAETSWSWVGSVNFYLRNTKTSLASIITDNLEAFEPNSFAGITWSVRQTAMDGLYYPSIFDLDSVILETDLDGLEYPGSQDLNSLITVTTLDGLKYPSAVALDNFVSVLEGLEYPPTISLNSLQVGAMVGMDYPTGIGTNRYSALLLTRPLDFSDYQNAIQLYRIGTEITDGSLVQAIVGKIAANWSTMNTEANKARLTTAFTNARVTAINRVRSVYGWTETVTLTPSTTSFIVGQAQLRYDIESVE
ncbi:virion structural protein [Klebsiella phage vB_KpM_Centimanus]|uniref:DUF7941 domain-family protein n=1 Tax=Klebsiella pneumoniae TaxID=573 RepID=UPI000D199B7E|nr:hypothetical protein [Klebsiella pneumoniae]